VWAAVTVTGWGRTLDITPLPAAFFWGVAGGYALITVLAIAFARGYRVRRQHHLAPVFMGALFGLMAGATLSFFLKDIGFSRLALLGGFASALTVLPMMRVALRVKRRRFERRAIFAGPPPEARRLADMLHAHLRPPFTLIGYVDDAPPSRQEEDLPYLGTLSKLRDLARIERADEIVFAADGLSNDATFRLMHDMRDLEVHFRILAEGRDHLIGKASVEDVGAPVVDAGEALGPLRNPVERRIFEIGAALLGLALHPATAAATALRPHGRLARLYPLTGRMWEVLRGRSPLIGLDTQDDNPELREWDLSPGVIAVTDVLPEASRSVRERRRTYAFYVRNQSARLDRDILLRVLRNLLNR
jgi:O-antigen biosynthesis protein